MYNHVAGAAAAMGFSGYVGPFRTIAIDNKNPNWFAWSHIVCRIINDAFTQLDVIAYQPENNGNKSNKNTYRILYTPLFIEQIKAQLGPSKAPRILSLS